MKNSPASLTPSHRVVLSHSAEQELERRWRQQGPVELEVFLAEWATSGSGPLAPDELTRLIIIDQQGRWPRQQRVSAEGYLARFPQLKTHEELALDVIYAEFLLCEELGESPSAEEYALRFPDWAETLRDQIEFHLAMDARGASPLQPEANQPTLHSGGTVRIDLGRPARLPQRLIPGYEIDRELGRGGMGIVYQARQLSLNRQVALKMLRAADCSSPVQLARFQAEAEAVARLHHPHIVQIYDYGEHDGWPYLALELVEGGSLAARLNGKPQPPRAAAEIIATLARTIHFAHEQGIVHRDLKPGNILLGSGDGEDPARWAVKITDFGLAKVFRDSAESHTHTGTIVGTPSYMAPEQARGNASATGAATDVYALGAMLYELLCGQPPFKEATPLETLHQVLNQDPAPVDRHALRTPRDLVTIVAKCLQKEPQRRYPSAADLADDLERFLGNRPIQARRTSAAERGWRWCRRNPALASLGGSVAMLLLTVAAVSFIYSMRLSHQLTVNAQAQRAEGDARRLAEVRLWDSYLAEINAGHGSHRIGQRTDALATVDRANDLLDSIGRTPERVQQLRSAAIASLAGPDIRQVRMVATSPPISSVDLSVAADRYVTATGNVLTVHRLSSGEVLHRISTELTGFAALISPDGKFVAATNSNGAKVWHCAGPRPKEVWRTAEDNRVTFSPDSRQAAVSDSAGGMRLIDLASGQTVRQLGKGQAQSWFAFHAASRRIAVCTPGGPQIIDWDTGNLLIQLGDGAASGGGSGVAWHPSGELLAVSGRAGGIELWDVATNRLRTTYPQRGYVTALYFNRGGDLLLAYNLWSSEMGVWNVGTGQEVLRDPMFLPFAPDRSASTTGEYLIQIGDDGVRLCSLEAGLAANPFPQVTEESLGDVKHVSTSPDGRFLAVGRGRGFELWDLVTKRRFGPVEAPFSAVEFNADGDLLVACQRGLYRWPRHDSPLQADGKPTSAPTLRFGPPEKLSGPLADAVLGMDASGTVLAVKAKAGWQAIRLGARAGVVKLAVNQEPRGVSVSPDGRWVALSHWNHPETILCNSLTGERVIELPAGRTGKPLFSPDGNWLATTPNGVCLWSVSDWKLATQVHAQGTTPSALGMAFSPDSRMLAVGQPHGVTRLVDPATGADWAELRRPDLTDSLCMAFTPDQSRLIEIPAGDRGAPRIWNLVEIRRELARRGLDWPADVLQFDPQIETSADSADLIVRLDQGNLFNQQAASDLIRETGYAKDDQARELLERAIKLDPENAQAQDQLAWLLVAGPESLRDPPQAVALARRALKLDEHQAAFWNTLGVALYRNGEYREAIAALEQSQQRGNESGAGFDWIFLALCHDCLGNATAADDYYQRAAAWFEQRQSRLSPLWQAELAEFLAEAKVAGLPRGN